MDIQIDPALGETGPWADGIRRANTLLERISGPSATVGKVKWELAQDAQNRPYLSLKLSDTTGSVEGKFSPEELKDAEHLWFRLNRLWGDLLQFRTQKLLLELHESLKGLEVG